MTEGLETKLTFPPSLASLVPDRARERHPRASRSQRVELLAELVAGFGAALPSQEDRGRGL